MAYTTKPTLKEYSKELIKLWDFDKNTSLDPEKLTIGSEVEAWWKCDKGHSYQRLICNQVKGPNCPVCSGKIIVKGVNDIFTIHPKLKEEWNFEKNTLDPYVERFRSTKKAWWKCKLGHEWQASLYDRTRDDGATGCPYCANKKVLAGYNDLASQRPELVLEWNYDKNAIMPTEVTTVSGKNVWWKCDLGHEWKAVIAARTKSLSGCPYCSGRKAIVGENDITTLYPELLEEWDYKKNKGIKPNEVKEATQRKLWWICKKCGKSYQKNMTEKLKSPYCPECSKGSHISFQEKAIAFYLSTAIDHVIENYRDAIIDGKELDIYLPDYAIGIEFDGGHYHNNSKDMIKSNLCKKAGIKLIRIRDFRCDPIETDDAIIIMNSYSDEELVSAIWKVCTVIGLPKIDVNLKKDRMRIMEKLRLDEKENNLKTTHPDLAAEWNYDKNGTIIPEMVTYGSTKKVWWKCTQGHEWDASISNRARLGRGCPYCAGKKVQGERDFFDDYPELKSLWHIEKNKEIDTTLISCGTHKKVWWKCDKGHEWEARIPDIVSGTRCPYCSGRKILVGFNDLASYDNKLMDEWDYQRNAVEPTEIRETYKKKVWWKCKECGEVYEKSPFDRIQGRRCPNCKYQYIPSKKN